MRLHRYINENNFLNEYLTLCETLRLDEMSGDTFEKIKAAGKKLGFKVKKSKSLFDYLKGVSRGTEDLLRYATLYMMTDVKDSESRKELVKDAKNTLRSVNKKDVVGLLMQLDKSSLGLTSHVRHIFQSIFGIEIATVNYWYEDVEYIQKEMRHVRVVLNRMDAKEELKALDKFEESLKDLFILGR